MKRLICLALLLTACKSPLTAQDDAELAEYKAQLSACLAAHPSDKPAQDSCMAQVRKDWAAKWDARFDGGFGG